MSQEIREKALSAAVTVAGTLGHQAVIQAAFAFETYLDGVEDTAVPVKPTATKPLAEKPAAEKIKPVTKPAVEKAKPVTKPATKDNAIDPDAKKMVGDKVNELLKANLRDQVVDLLASFDGAQSATGIVTQGQSVIDSFIEQADALLAVGAEEGGLAD